MTKVKGICHVADFRFSSENQKNIYNTTDSEHEIIDLTTINIIDM